MTAMKLKALLFAVVTAVCVHRLASVAGAALAAPANSQLGAQIVATGTQKGSVACARCHGFDGASDGSGAFPVLAGQSADYLAAQLRRFASGQRQNALMESIAKGLTDDELLSVTQYYSAARPVSSVTRQATSNQVTVGQRIALVGNLNTRVQACVSCHGPYGTGEPPTIPYLSGQYRHYIEVQLQMFRRGYRKSSQMLGVGHNLTADEAAAVAAYFDQLPLPSTQ